MVVPTDIQVSFITGAFLADLGAPVIEAASRESRERLGYTALPLGIWCMRIWQGRRQLGRG
jgi:hypothetical protein